MFIVRVKHDVIKNKINKLRSNKIKNKVKRNYCAQFARDYNLYEFIFAYTLFPYKTYERGFMSVKYIRE